MAERTGHLARREWRWTWAALAVRWPLTVLVLLPLLPPWALAKGFTWAYDGLIDWMWSIQIRAYNLDLARRGDFARLPAPELSDEWKARANGDDRG